MKISIYILFLLSFTIGSVWADEHIEKQILGEWVSFPKKNRELVYIFEINNKFIWKEKGREKTFYTEGKYQIQEMEGRILIDFHDFSYPKLKNNTIKGLIKFINNNTFQIDGKKYEKNNVGNYPTEFGKETIIFTKI